MGVEPLSGHREQNQYRNQNEHPQRPELRLAQHHRGGGQTAEAGQVDELVHVAPRCARGGQSAQHDATEQQCDAQIDQCQTGLAESVRQWGRRRLDHNTGPIRVRGDAPGGHQFALFGTKAATGGEFHREQHQRHYQDDD